LDAPGAYSRGRE